MGDCGQVKCIWKLSKFYLILKFRSSNIFGNIFYSKFGLSNIYKAIRKDLQKGKGTFNC